MNVLSKSLHIFKSIQVKACREIQFSNGGHLFAAAYGSGATNVFNFYTNECPPNFQCKGHVQKVRAIDWYENDMGFVSAGQGGDVFFWDLFNVKEGSNRNTEKDFTQKNVAMTGVVNIPKRKYEVYCVGNDGKIWNSNMPKEPYEAS